MTICTLLFTDTFPIAITDNLISNKLGDDELSTPISGKENRIGFEGYKPAGIANKVWKVSIGDKLESTYYMMYSGNIEHAKKLSDYIKSKLSYQTVDEINTEDIENYITQNQLDIGVILVYMDKDGYFSHYYVNANRHIYQPIILSIGSGRDELACVLQRIYDRHYNFISEISLLDIHKKIGLSLLVISYLTSDYLYLGNYSSFAKKSCGALYHNYTFPKLYYDSINNIPNYIKNGCCQIFIDFCYIQNKFFIKRLVHTKQCYKTEDVISTVIETNQEVPKSDNNEIILEASYTSSKVYIIKNYKDDIEIIQGLDSFSASQLILYASIGNEHTRTIHYFTEDDIIFCSAKNSIFSIRFNYYENYNFFTRITDRIRNYYFKH